MDKAAKPTALFFGFLAASMTYVSAQAAPQPASERTVPAIQREVGPDRQCGSSQTLAVSSKPTSAITDFAKRERRIIKGA